MKTAPRTSARSVAGTAAPKLRGRAAPVRLPKGQQTRSEILRIAAQLASSEGLEGLSLGRLAAAVGMSKSGLFAHFRSKEELQLAVVNTAKAMFIEEVIQPAVAVGDGFERLCQLAENWLSYAQRKVFQGGCFFMAASLEFDNRPGVVRERITAIMNQWLELLASEVRRAQAEKTLSPRAKAEQLAFEFNAQMMGANWAYQLLGDQQAFAKAKTAIVDRLKSYAPQKAARLGVARN
jgi:AcrR family transcriptional regulator